MGTTIRHASVMNSRASARLSGGHPRVDPVVARVAAALEQEPVGLGRYERWPFFLRKSEAEDRLVGRDRRVDDPAYAELHVVADEVLLGPRQRQRPGAHVVNRHGAVPVFLMVGHSFMVPGSLP